MKYKSGIVICMLLGLVMAFTSCVKDNEMGLNEMSEPSSVITSDLRVTSLKTSDFIDQPIQREQIVHIDTTNLELNSSEFFKKELKKTNLTFQFKNSLSKDFRIDFEFLNDRDELKFALQIPVSAGTKEKPITVETTVVIEAHELNTFKEATKLVFKVTRRSSDASVLPESEGLLELQSEATYFFDI